MIKTGIYTGLLLLFWLTAQGQQQPIINGTYSGTSIARVLDEWSIAYKVNFAYDSYELNKFSGSWEFNNQSLSIALEKLLGDFPLAFTTVDDVIVIYPAEQSTVVGELPQAGNYVFIAGTVVDARSGEVLPYAAIGITGGKADGLADEFGRFSLAVTSTSETDTLMVSYLGYQPYAMPLQRARRGVELRIGLIQTSTVLRDVYIRGLAPGAQTISSKFGTLLLAPDDYAARFGVGEPDVFRVAQLLPGVGATTENNNGLIIRGSSPDQSQLLLDGFNIYHQDHFFGMFSAVNAYAVKTMHLHKGPADVTIGGRSSGTLELIGREGDLRKPSARVEMGTLSVSGAIETPLDSSGKASVFICGRRSLIQAFQSPAYKGLFNTLYSSAVVYADDEKLDAFDGSFKPGVMFQDINAKITYKANERTRLTTSLYASRDDMEFQYADTAGTEAIDAVDVRYNDETAKVNRGASIRWLQQFNQEVQVLTSVGFSNFTGNYFSSDSIRNNLFAVDSIQFLFREIELRDWNLQQQWTINKPGSEYKMGWSSNSIQTLSRSRSSFGLDTTMDHHAFVHTVFAGENRRLAKGWYMHSGLRLNYYTALGNMYLEPRWSLHKKFADDRLELRCAAGLSNQFIQRTSTQNMYQNTPDVWTLSGNGVPVLRTAQLTLGGLWQWRNLSVDAECYRKWNQGQIANRQSFLLNRPVEASEEILQGDADILGLDVMVQWHYKRHRLLGAYTRVYAYSDYGAALPGYVLEGYFRAHELKLNYEWEFNGWSFSCWHLMSSGAPYTALAGTYAFVLPGGSSQTVPLSGGANDALTRRYVRTDIMAGRSWNVGSHRITFRLTVYNIMNIRNVAGVQYLVERSGVASSDFSMNERNVYMIGRIPSLYITWQF